MPTQQQRISAAVALGIHRLSGIRHSALRLALMEQHEKAHPNRDRILRIVDRFKVATAFGFYSSRQELWRAS
jgi:hypothetical protein